MWIGASSDKIRPILLLVILGLSPVLAAQPPPASVGSPEKEEKAELFVALLKRRAQRLLQEKRAPPPPVWDLFSGISEGYESNVNLDGTRKGDTFTEETFSLVFRPRMASWLKGEFSSDLSHTHFTELTDSNLWSSTFGAVLQFQPRPPLQLDLGYEYGILNFPLDSDNSFFDQRFRAHLSVAQRSWVTHRVGWTYQKRDYDARRARDSDGNAVPLFNRQDQRHTGIYEVRLRFPKTFARLAGEFYRNFSNDHFQDFYDWGDLRLLGAVTRTFTRECFGTFTASVERKNYQKRSVPAINVAERDNLWTLAGSLVYQLTRHWSVNYSLTYRYQDSNDPRLDFTDWINQMGISISF